MLMESQLARSKLSAPLGMSDERVNCIKAAVGQCREAKDAG